MSDSLLRQAQLMLPVSNQGASIPEDALSRKVCERIRQIRIQKGYSIDYVSKQLGLHLSTVSKIERSFINPSLDMIDNIATVLGADLCNIINEIKQQNLASSIPKEIDTDSEIKWPEGGLI